MELVPLYIVLRRFIDNYGNVMQKGAEGNFEILFNFLLEYKNLLKRIEETDNKDIGLLFLRDMPILEDEAYYKGTFLSNLAEALLDKQDRLFTFFKENERAILDPLTNYLDFVRRGG
jgi:hypothetical protein